jgi:hypothetical protein
MVGLVIMVFGESVKAFLDAYFDLTAIAFAVLFIAGFGVVNLLARRGARRAEQVSQSGTGSSLPATESEPAP